jgi:hypothetical protein
MAPLAALEEARLLTAAESKLYALVSGELHMHHSSLLDNSAPASNLDLAAVPD